MDKQKGFLASRLWRRRTGEAGLAPILIVLLIAVAVGGYLIYQKQSKPAVVPQIAQSSTAPVSTSSATNSAITTNWKTYTNTALNYSFNYPADFKLTEESSDKVRISNNLPSSPNCKGGGCNLGIPKLTIYFEHLNNLGEDKLSLDEFSQQRHKSLLTINNDQGNIQTMQKYGYEMKYFEGTTEGYNHNYYLRLNKKINFVITVSFPSKDEVAKYSELETQILSTFRFLN